MSECPECAGQVDRVDGRVNPRNALLVYRTVPCGHGIGLHEALSRGIEVHSEAVNADTLVAAERRRQVTEEGYTPEHDDQHTAGQLPWAAYSVLDKAAGVGRDDWTEQAHPMWPFDRAKWPQDKTRMRLLIIAAALIHADIERGLRKGERP